MSQPIDSVRGPKPERRSKDRRAKDRRSSDRRKSASKVSAALPVPVAAPPSRSEAQIAAAAFEAQRLGQPGEKRGLRAGQELLERARSAYLETEWSGRGDRRGSAGKTAKTDI